MRIVSLTSVLKLVLLGSILTGCWNEVDEDAVCWSDQERCGGGPMAAGASQPIPDTSMMNVGGAVSQPGMAGIAGTAGMESPPPMGGLSDPTGQGGEPSGGIPVPGVGSICGDGQISGDEECEPTDDGCLPTCLLRGYVRLGPTTYQVGLAPTDDESAVPTTVLSRPFDMGRTEVTVIEWNEAVKQAADWRGNKEH